MDVEERDRLYQLITEHGNITRYELLKKTGWDREKLSYYLDLLYWEGLIDLRGRKKRMVSPVEKDLINRTFLERHIDTPYLFYNIDMKKVGTLLEGEKPKPSTEEPQRRYLGPLEKGLRTLTSKTKEIKKRVIK
jgi:hypothetical protein